MTALGRIERDYEKNIIGYSVVGLTVSTVLGAVAVMTTVMQGNGFYQMLQLFLVVAACSTHNGMILTVQKPSLIIKTLKISILVSFLVMTLGVAFNAL